MAAAGQAAAREADGQRPGDNIVSLTKFSAETAKAEVIHTH